MACAVCRNADNVVVNIIVADPTDLAPQDCYLVEIPAGVVCEIGSVWDGANFTDPVPPANPDA